MIFFSFFVETRLMIMQNCGETLVGLLLVDRVIRWGFVLMEDCHNTRHFGQSMLTSLSVILCVSCDNFTHERLSTR
jgi:hypothetical protein